MRIAVCDDEEPFLDKMDKLLREICKKHNIDCMTSLYSSSEELVDDSLGFHVVFIDIEMPNENGLDAVNRINEKKDKNRFPLIVFVTNMDSYVFSALRHYPFAFLRKFELEGELERCMIRLHSEVMSAEKDFYHIKNGRNDIVVELDKIIYLEKEKNYVKFVSENGAYRERTDIKEKLNDLQYKGFIRIHIGFLVNRRYIYEIQTNNIVLTNGQLLPLSKKYRDAAKREFFEWLGRNND